MTYVNKQGDLFDSTADAIGHGVNCKGLMGAGIAKAFRTRWPEMYREYRMLCQEELLHPGQIYPYQTGAHVAPLAVINIASQEYPGPDAKLEWLSTGVTRALMHCSERGLTSLALPRIGCGIGGLVWENVEPVLEAIAEGTDVELEVWTL